MSSTHGIKNQNKGSNYFTARPSKYPQGGFNTKPCKWCSNIFEPVAPSHLYCSDPCRDDANSDRYYRNAYGVGVAEVRRIKESQGGKCAICLGEGFKMRGVHKSALNLDHCHTTGAVRGLLCHNCNRGIGLLQDDPDYLRRAIEYVTKSR
mgnify:CR=1 FL=1